jgi:diguanylate cyclase
MGEPDEHNDGAAKWRDKYLDALDEQERQEQAHQADRALLTRALTRVCLAAEGQSSELDSSLEALRHSLRENNLSAVQGLLDKLEQTLLEFERTREQNTATQVDTLQAMAGQLLALSPDRALKKQLRALSQAAARQREQLDTYPQLLRQLEQLQHQVLAQQPAEPSPSGGFMARLLGGGKAESQPADPPPEAQAHTHAASGAPSGKADRALFELNPNATLRDSETVSENLRTIITQLLQSVEAQAIAPERVSALQNQLRAGISNADLLPALEEVRDLVMAAYMAATRTFASYLTAVNLDLTEIYRAIEGAAHSSANLQQAGEQMQLQVLNQFAKLEDQSAQATDLDHLKHQVQDRLGHIRAALTEYQNTSGQESSAGTQLNELATRLREMEQEAQRSRKVLAEQRAKALTDPLTGLPNREAYRDRMQHEQQRFTRYGHPLTLAVIDLDFFKKINDSLGHQAGDRVLQVLSNAIAKRLREVDFFGRYGGEEFVVAMPDTTGQQAFGVLDRIRAAIAKTAFNYKNTPVTLTISIGIVQFTSGMNAESAFEHADKALYDAKAAGRNQCIIATPPS